MNPVAPVVSLTAVGHIALSMAIPKSHAAALVPSLLINL